MANQVAAMTASKKLEPVPASNEYHFIFYEELSCFKIRKTTGLHLWLLPRTTRTQIDGILEKYHTEVSSVVKSCSEKYTGIETIIYSNILLLLTILSIILLNQKLLQDGILLSVIILTHILFSITVTVVLCQCSKKNRWKRLSQISRKLNELTQNLNASSGPDSLQMEVKMDSAPGNWMEFSLVFKIKNNFSPSGPDPRTGSLDSKARSKFSTTVAPKIQPGQSMSAARVITSEQNLQPTEEQVFIQRTDSPLGDSPENPRYTRPKTKMMTVGPGMRRIPKMATIIQKRGSPNKSANQLREI